MIVQNTTYLAAVQTNKEGEVIGKILVVVRAEDGYGKVWETKSLTSVNLKGESVFPHYVKGWKRIVKRLFKQFSGYQIGWQLVGDMKLAP